MSDDTLKTLATIARHREYVKVALKLLATNLEMRGLNHDLSKYREDEIEGYARINRIARENPYGSDEYRESLGKEKGVIDLHFSRNRHHPEFHATEDDMSFLDIIEMVCDWWSASRTYGQSSLRDSLPIHRERFSFTDAQWWLIIEMVRFLEGLE